MQNAERGMRGSGTDTAAGDDGTENSSRAACAREVSGVGEWRWRESNPPARDRVTAEARCRPVDRARRRFSPASHATRTAVAWAPFYDDTAVAKGPASSDHGHGGPRHSGGSMTATVRLIFLMSCSRWSFERLAAFGLAGPGAVLHTTASCVFRRRFPDHHLRGGLGSAAASGPPLAWWVRVGRGRRRRRASSRSCSRAAAQPRIRRRVEALVRRLANRRRACGVRFVRSTGTDSRGCGARTDSRTSFSARARKHLDACERSLARLSHRCR